MSDVVERRTLKRGDHVFREGEAGVNAFILQDGEVEIFKNIGGDDKVLANIGQGSIFGEMALIDAQPRMASARMKVGGTVIVVTPGMFELKMRKTDPFIRGLLKILVDNLRLVQSK
ncbi:MAG: Crp/Fnr family transcriptional regulator [Rhodospirillales bacterium]